MPNLIIFGKGTGNDWRNQS